MTRKISIAVLLIVFFFLAGSGYILFNKNEYTTNFETSAAPGIVYHKLVSGAFESFENQELLEKIPFQKIQQKVSSEDIPFVLTWNLTAANDSVTLVKLRAKSSNTSFKDRLALLFRQTGFSEKLELEVSRLRNTLDSDKELYQVTIEGEQISPETTCACISLKSEIDRKAFKMMANIDHLSEFVLQHDLETTGRPRVIIQKWDLEEGFIDFDFCFPLKGDRQPPHPFIFFRKIPAAPSLKAVFKGNYMFSHLAWLELLNYAEQNEKNVVPEPQEIFHNNPELGGNPKEWRTEIYLPLAQ